MLLVATGCQNQTQDKPNNIEDTYKAISAYFSNSYADKSNLSAFYVDSDRWDQLGRRRQRPHGRFAERAVRDRFALPGWK